jgi:hypothetical protein
MLYFEQFDHRLIIYRCDALSSVRLDLYESFTRKFHERLAHWRGAQAQLQSNLGVFEKGTRLQFPQHDGLA